MVDLSEASVIDVHCHPWRNQDLLALDPEGFEDRITMMGMCQITAGQVRPGLEGHLKLLTESTPFALTMRRRLAKWLDCESLRPMVAARRQERLASDAHYITALLREANITGLLYDEGYPQPTISREEFAAASGVQVYRVARIEPWIADLQKNVSSYGELEEAFVARLDAAASDPALVAYKSVIAYRTGLDVGNPSRGECEGAFRLWQADNFRETRQYSKPIRDALLRQTLRAARRHDRIVHIHCGGGDPEIRLSYARPQDLFPLLTEHDQPIVLIHSGWPWIEEAAYVASVLPYVYLDVSVMVPWSSLAIDQKLEVLLGAAPPAKVLYGSDEASEPEVVWLSALLAKEALGRVLSGAVERAWLSTAEACRIGYDVLAGNTCRLHGIQHS